MVILKLEQLELGQLPRLPPPLGLLRATSAGRHPAGLHQGHQHGKGEKLPRPLLHLQPLQRLPSAQGLVPEPLVLLPKQRHLRLPHHQQRAQLRLPALQEFPERPPLAKPERERHLQHHKPKDRWHLRQRAIPAAEVGRHPKRAAPSHLSLQPGKEAIPWRELRPGSRGKNGRKIEQRLFFRKRVINLEINLHIYLENRTFATKFLLNCNFAA